MTFSCRWIQRSTNMTLWIMTLLFWPHMRLFTFTIWANNFAIVLFFKMHMLIIVYILLQQLPQSFCFWMWYVVGYHQMKGVHLRNNLIPNFHQIQFWWCKGNYHKIWVRWHGVFFLGSDGKNYIVVNGLSYQMGNEVLWVFLWNGWWSSIQSWTSMITIIFSNLIFSCNTFFLAHF